MRKKTYIYKYLLVLLMGFGAVYSCTDLNDPHQEYLDLGEEIYVGKPLFILTNSGNERIKFNIIINADPKISKGLITWNNNTESHEFTVNRQSESYDLITTEMDIPEGSYAFDVRLQDDAGKESLGFEHSAVVYGEKYSASLVNRGISGIEALPGQAKIMWANPEPSVTTTTFKYENINGASVEVEVLPTESELIINDYVLGGSFTYYTWHKPTEVALDSFKTYTETGEFPATVLLDRSAWQKVVLPTDGEFNCYGGSIENLWDGSKDSWYHSYCVKDGTDGIPHHFTLDLGVNTVLSKFLISPRQSHNGRNPKKFQVWGIDDLTGAETTADPQDPNWADDAVAKGWTLLLDVDDTNWKGSKADFEVDIAENISIKYIRFRFVESYESPDGNQQTALSEFKFWASSIN